MTPCPIGTCLSPRSCTLHCGASADWRNRPRVMLQAPQTTEPGLPDEPLWHRLLGAAMLFGLLGLVIMALAVVS